MAKRRRLVSLGVLVASSLMPYCGGGGSGPPTSPNTPTPTPAPVTTVVSQGSGSLPVNNLGAVNFTISAAGRVDVTVDWTFAANDVDIGVFNGTCTATQLVAGSCAPVTVSDSVNKPERISLANAAAGNYTLGVENVGPSDESVSWQVTLTR